MPRFGLSSRARPRSSVDLPQALGPTMTVIRPDGMATERCCRHLALAVGETEVRQPTSLAAGLRIGHGHPPRPARLERASSHSRYGAPTTPVTTPTGSSVGANSRRATRSDSSTSRAPTSAAGTSASGSPVSRRAIGPATKATKMIGPAAAVAVRGEGDGDEHERQPGALDADAEALGGVVAELQHAQRTRSGRRRAGISTSVGDGDGPHVLPAAPVEAAGEPDDGPLSLEDLGAREQVLRHARQQRRRCRRRRARGGTATPRSSTRAGRWRRRRRVHRRRRRTAVAAVAALSTTMQNTAAALAPASMPMMSGLASGLRARLWKIARTARTTPRRARR